MRLKSELYKQEQHDIRNKIISILDLEHKNTYTLYELDQNKEIQQKIIELIPEIRKWYSFNGIKAVGDPEKIKRPYLSIIKHLLKTKYTITISKVKFYKEKQLIQTMEYLFTVIVI